MPLRINLGYRRVLGVFLVVVLAWITIKTELTPGFPDADSYYHGHVARLMIEQRGFVHSYPWLTFMTWRDGYVDAHLGYHLWLIPFVGLFGLEAGMKVSAGVGALLAIGAVYWGMRRLNPRWALWLTWVVILTDQFMFRLLLPRAPALAVALLIPFIFSVIERRWRLVGILSLIFAFMYHSWPVLTVVVVVGMIAEMIERRWYRQPHSPIWPVPLAHLAGVALSYLANPYFPQNIRFSWLDIVTIGFFNDRQAIKVGGEWYPAGDAAFIQAVGWPTLVIAGVVMTVILAVFLRQRRLIQPLTPSQRRSGWILLLLTLLFFGQASSAQRYFEYLVPTLILLTALLLNVVTPYVNVLRQLLSASPNGHLVIRLALVALIITPLAVDAREIVKIGSAPNDQRARQVAPALQTIAAQVPAGSVVYHNRWDDGPTFAVAEPRLRYLIGLDPTFFANYDRTAFDTWKALGDNRLSDPAGGLRALGARAAIIRTLGSVRASEMPLTFRLDALPGSRRIYDSPDLVAFIFK